MSYQLAANGFVIRLADKAYIPPVLDNQDYLTYMKWIDEGNTVEPEHMAEDYQAQTLRSIAERRFKAETSGITVLGIPVNTERDSQALITGATLSAIIDPTYVCNWKTSQGWVQLDAETLKMLAQAVRAHVQACFNREGELVAEVLAGTYSNTLLNAGWPE